MLPGDAVLVAGQPPRVMGHHIQAVQKGLCGFAADDACWTHVAVYVGEGLLVEAVPFYGVRVSSIYSLVPGNLLLVRRDTSLDNEQRYRIAIQAATRLGRGYSVAQIPALAAGAAVGFWQPETGVRLSRALVCSTLYSDSYVAVVQRLLFPNRISELWPGHISATPNLSDVPVPWIGVN
jgi:hypothetical protein